MEGLPFGCRVSLMINRRLAVLVEELEGLGGKQRSMRTRGVYGHKKRVSAEMETGKKRDYERPQVYNQKAHTTEEYEGGTEEKFFFEGAN